MNFFCTGSEFTVFYISGFIQNKCIIIFFHKEQEKTVPISLIFYYLGNLSGKNGLSNKINFFSFQKGDHGMYAGRLINPTLAQV